MARQQLINEILRKMFADRSEMPTPEEYAVWLSRAEEEAIEIEAKQRCSRINGRLDEVYALIDKLAQMETLAEEDDVEGFDEARIEACQALFDRIELGHRKLIWDSRPRYRTRSSSEETGETFTEERKQELDQAVMRGQSGIYGMRLRKRDGWKDRGAYAGKVCLITRHGWSPIVVPGGVEELLRRLGIWGKYQDRWPSNSKQVPFDRQDRFTVDWERHADGTRTMVRVVG